MRSKTSFFNPTLFRKNLSRFWPLWGGASLAGALAPLAMLMSLLDEGFLTHNMSPLELTTIYYSAVSWIVPTFSLFYAAVCALAVWHFLYNARSVSLCHALPITRASLFLTNLLSGMAMLLIPYAVTGGLAVLISLPAGLFDPTGVFMTILYILGESLFYFASASIVIFITGNPFAFGAFYFLLHFFAVLAEMLVSYLMSMFYFGVEQMYEGVVEFLSPTVYLINHVQAYGQSVHTTAPNGGTSTTLSSVVLENSWLIGVYALVGVVLLGLSWLLYQRRRSESAGDVVAVGWMKPVFRYGFAMCAALAGGVLLYTILWDSFQHTETADTIPMAVFMAVAGLLGYYVASMLLAKSVKVFRGTGRGALATIAAAVVLCFVIAADPAGVESWVPSPEQLNEAHIFISTGNGGSVSANFSDPDGIQKILDAHQAVLAERNALNQRSGNNYDYVHVNLYYYKPDGRDAYRFYTLRFSKDYADQSGAVQLLRALSTDPAIQESNIFRILDGAESVRLTGGHVTQVYNPETQSMESLDLSVEQARALEDAVRRDIQAGNFGRTVFMDDYNEYQSSIYTAELTFYYNIVRNDRVPTDYSNSTRLMLSIYCTETLQALRDAGVLDDTHILLTQRESNNFYDGRPFDYEEWADYEMYY